MIKKLFSGSELKKNISKGSFWLTSGTAIEQGLRFVRNIILTRILAPEAFGIMAIILALNAAIESFTEVGIKQAVIQNKDSQEKTYLNSAWFLSILRSMLLYLISFFLAPFIAEFYNNPELTIFIRIAFLGIVFRGLISPRAYIALKQMRFNKWVFLFNGGGILGVIITVILAIFMKNVWALVIGFTLESVIRCILSFIFCPYLPGFDFDKEHRQKLFKFARGMLGLPILTFIFMRTDIFVIGKIYSPSELGLYSMAAALANLPLHLGTVLDQLLLPIFSKLQENFSKLNDALIKVTFYVVILTFPSMLFICFSSSEILNIVYGAEYSTMAIPFSIIFITILIRLSSLPIMSVYLAVGKPNLNRIFAGIRALLILIIIIPMIKLFGFIGAASAALISLSISYVVQIFQLKKLTKIYLYKYVSIFLYIGAILFISITFIFSLIVIFNLNDINFNPLLKFLLAGVFSLLGYLLIFLTFHKIKERIL